MFDWCIFTASKKMRPRNLIILSMHFFIQLLISGEEFSKRPLKANIYLFLKIKGPFRSHYWKPEDFSSYEGLSETIAHSFFDKAILHFYTTHSFPTDIVKAYNEVIINSSILEEKDLNYKGFLELRVN